MSSTLHRLVIAVVVAATLATVAPGSSAKAATPPPASAKFVLPLPAAGVPALGSLGVVAPGLGQVAAVIGPTIITTAPTTYINSNTQVSAGGAVNGGQAGL
jgi:hypothetical protein